MNNRIKKMLALVLALVFVVALFAGCGGNNSGSSASGSGTASGSGSSTNSGSTSGSGSTDSGSTSGSDDAGSAPADEGPYCLAAGKYELNDRGFPTAHYEYMQPLSTTDEVFSKWTTCYTPQYIPEDDWNNIPTWQELEQRTGVHIEYNIVASSTRSQNFSVLLAADDLDDIMDQGSYYYTSGTLKEACEEGYFANLYEYKEYLPNYLYLVGVNSEYNVDIYAKAFYDSETITTIYGMVHDPCAAEGYMLRQDWLDQMAIPGLTNAIDVTTYDELDTVLYAMKSTFPKNSAGRENFPLFINNIGEVYQSALVGGFDTCLVSSSLAYPRTVNGKVDFCGTTSDDLEMMTLMHKWYADGMISPNFGNFVAGEDYDCGSHDDTLGCNLVVPSAWDQLEEQSENPNAKWEPIKRTRKYEGQIFKYGYVKPRDIYSYGSANINGKCENIPLAASWIDYGYSEIGSDFVSWGTEGYLWEYNENGERRLTEWCLTHEATPSWLLCIYATNGLLEATMMHNMRNYYYEGGDRCLRAFEVFNEDEYYGEYDFPSSVKFTDEERDENTRLLTDLNTYFSENYMLFLTGDKPLSDWDSYIADLNTFGLETLTANYQAAYERYMAEF